MIQILKGEVQSLRVKNSVLTESIRKNEMCTKSLEHVGLQTDLYITTKSTDCTCKCTCNSTSSDCCPCQCDSEPCVCKKIGQCSSKDSSNNVSCDIDDSSDRKPLECTDYTCDSPTSKDCSPCQCNSEPCVCNKINKCASNNNISCDINDDSSVQKPSKCADCAPNESSRSADAKKRDNCVAGVKKADKLQRRLDKMKQLFKEKMTNAQKMLIDTEENMKSEMECLKTKHKKELEELTAQLKMNKTVTDDSKVTDICPGNLFARCCFFNY